MNPIDVIIDAVWRGSQAVNQAKKELGGVEDSAKKGSAGFEKYAAAAAKVGIALGAVAVVSRTTYQALERGAGLELTRQRFDRLAESIGTTGEALREDLGRSTAGLLSDAQQMALATDLIALGLANTHDEAVRLGRVAAELDQDVGELALALVNQTTRRFDQLGVSAVGFEERLKALEGQGLDTQAAFTEAFLQQAEDQIERVGGKAGTAAGDLQKMEAAFLDVKDAASEALLDIVRFTGGFEDIEEATEALQNLADAIEEIGNNFDKLRAVGQGVEFITDPFGNLEEAYETIRDLQKDLSGQLEDYLAQNERYQEILDGVVDTLEDIEQLTGVELIGNMEQAIEEAESFDRVLTRASDTVSEIVQKLSEIEIGRGSLERGGGSDGRSGEIVRQQFGTIAERVELFQEFQDNLKAINTEGAEERAEIEREYEERRNKIVEDYAAQRAQEEEDYQRRLQRIQEDYQRNIEDLQSGAVEDQQDARNDANERLEDLERDHIRRLQDIIDNANLQLAEAASRLDASAVARIQRQRDDALRRENQNFSDQQSDVKRQLDEQLREISDNLDRRLEELREFHELRLERDEEDRQIRLDRLEEAHQDELRELDEQYRQRQQDLKDAIKAERTELTRRYTEAYNELTQHWSDRQTLEARYQADILAQEEAWWNQRLALVGGDSVRNGTTGGDGSGGTGAGGEVPPNRSELLAMVSNLAMEQNYPDNIIQGLLRSMQSWTDEQIAKWIERTFGIDVPGYQLGTPFVPQTGLAMLHQGERVLTAAENRVFSSGNIGNFTFNIQTQPGMDEAKVARMARREFEDFLREMA